MAKPLGSGGNAAVFQGAVASSSSGGGSIGTPEQMIEAYQSELINRSFEMYDITQELSPEEYAIATGARLVTDTDEEYAAKRQALIDLGLDPDKGGALYHYNPVDQESDVYIKRATEEARRGAGLSDIPTSSTNYERPRTVAAGWDPNDIQDPKGLGTLTVVFRDGTPYNFYDVPYDRWVLFRASYSKGRGWLGRLDSRDPGSLVANYAHGPADMSGMSEDMVDLVYQAARTAQIYNRKGPSAPKHYQVGYETVKKPTKRQQPRVTGKNPSGSSIVRKRQSTTGTAPKASRHNTSANKKN